MQAWACALRPASLASPAPDCQGTSVAKTDRTVENDMTTTPAGGPKVMDSQSLFEGGTEVCIAHEGLIYRLKITRQGKLILNK